MPLRDLLGGAGGNDSPAAVASLRSHVDDIVRGLDDIEIVFNDHGGVAALDEFAQDLCQLGNIVEMETGGGLIQDIDGLSGTLSGKFRRQLDALGLAAGELRGGLAELDIAQSHIIERLDLAADGGNIFKKFQRLLDSHFQDIRDVFALVADLQGLTVVAFAVADFTGDIDIGQKMHLDLDDAVAGAGFAPPSLYIEGEAAFGIAAGAGVLGPREEGADQIKDAGIGRRIRPGSPADRGLVDIDDLVQLFDPLDVLVLTGDGARPVQVMGQSLIEDFVHQRALAGA